jgi:ligand-binding sensor domain-containing protein
MRLTSFLLLLILTSNLSAQNYTYKHYTVQDGLPQTQIMQLEQDSKGNLWIGTKLGISKFDGKEFENFGIKDGLLGTTTTASFLENEKGDVLIPFANGFNVYDGREIKTVIYPEKGGVDDRFIEVCFFSSEQVLLKRMDKLKTNILRYSFNKDSWAKVKADDLLRLISNGKEWYEFVGSDHRTGVHPTSNIIVYSIDFSSNRPFISNQKSVHLNDRQVLDISLFVDEQFCRIEDGKLVPFPVEVQNSMQKIILEVLGDEFKGKPTALEFMYAYSSRFRIGKGKKPNVYIFSGAKRSALIKIDGITGKIDKMEVPAIINDLLEDADGNLWVGTEIGLFKYFDLRFQSWQMGKCSTIPRYIWSIVEHSEGEFILGSHGDGMHYFTPPNNIEECVKCNQIGINKDAYMGAIRTQKGEVLMSEDGFLVGVNPQKKVRSVFGKRDGKKWGAALMLFEDTLNQQILHGGNRGVWFIKNNKGIKNITKDELGLSTIIAIEQIGDSVYVFGSFRGYAFYNLHTEEITTVNYDKELVRLGKSTPANTNLVSITKDKRKNLWMGGFEGLRLYLPHSQEMRAIPLGKSVTIGSLKVSQDGKYLLIGTLQNLVVFDLEVYYNTGEIRTRTYDKDSGFIGVEPGQNGFMQDSEGNVWLTTSDKLMRFKLDEAIFQTTKLTPYVESSSYFDKESLIWQEKAYRFSDSTKTIFRYNENSVRFQFKATTHNSPDLVLYSYRLLDEEGEGTWVETKEREASFSNLSHGKYIFQLRARHTFSNYPREIYEVRFEVIPAWYQLMSVRILLFLLGVALVSLLVYRLAYLPRIRKTKEQLRISRLEEQKLRAQTNPHFLSNALASVQAMVLREDAFMASKFIVKFAVLVRNTFDFSQKESSTLFEELKMVREYVEVARTVRSGDFLYHDQEIDERIDVNQTLVPPFILQPIVENALDYGIGKLDRQGEIKVSVSLDESGQLLKISIKDNGRGLDSKVSESFQLIRKSDYHSTEIIQSRLDIFNQNLSKKMTKPTFRRGNIVEEGEVKGTCVEMMVEWRKNSKI